MYLPDLADVSQWGRTLAGALLLPPAPMLAALGLAVALHGRARRLSVMLSISGLVAIWLSCTDVGADGLERLLLEVPAALSARDIHELASADHTVVWVLGAGAYRYRPEYNGPSLKPLTLERLRYGLWLARQTNLPLGFSGGLGRRAEPGSVTEASLAAQVAEDEHDRPLAYAEDRSRDTRENASLSMAMLANTGVRRLVLVTHVQHMPRALRAFRAAAPAEVQFLAAPVGVHADTPHVLSDWLPSNSGFLRCRYVVYEWLGGLAGH